MYYSKFDWKRRENLLILPKAYKLQRFPVVLKVVCGQHHNKIFLSVYKIKDKSELYKNMMPDIFGDVFKYNLVYLVSTRDRQYHLKGVGEADEPRLLIGGGGGPPHHNPGWRGDYRMMDTSDSHTNMMSDIFGEVFNCTLAYLVSFFYLFNRQH